MPYGLGRVATIVVFFLLYAVLPKPAVVAPERPERAKESAAMAV
ncbi:hypothetical protein [Streptomyces sp. NBC_00203]